MSSPFDFQKQPNPRSPEAFQKAPAPQPAPGYQPPALGNLAKPGGAQLGNLAQSARSKELGNAKTTLIVIGILVILWHLVMLVNLPNEVQQTMRKTGSSDFSVGETSEQTYRIPTKGLTKEGLFKVSCG